MSQGDVGISVGFKTKSQRVELHLPADKPLCVRSLCCDIKRQTSLMFQSGCPPLLAVLHELGKDKPAVAPADFKRL